MSNHELMPAINLLERRVEDQERKVNELLGALNVLRAEVDLPPRAPFPSGGAEKGDAQTQIKSDTFFNKKQQTAIRQYLEIRRAQGLGPAKPREIYDALITGGFQYTAKDAETALVGLRALLRKRTNVFAKVGSTGAYGLVAWYGKVKQPKSNDSNDEDDDANDSEQENTESGTNSVDDSEKESEAENKTADEDEPSSAA